MARPALVALTLSLATSVCLAASPLPGAPVEQAGLSAEGLARIDRFFDAEIDRQRLPGAVIAIARDGRLVHHKAYGQLDPQSGTAMPLLHQPGTVWDYGLSTDVLGLVIEKVSGKRLGEFLREAVFDKVGMPDTNFEPSQAQRARLARPLPTDPLTGKPQRIISLDATPHFDCGGACAFGTMGDYLRFGQMLLDGGAIDGRRVLSPHTVAWMTSDHLGPRIRNQVGQTEPHRDGYAWGLGVAVRMQDGLAATPGSRGDFTWNGANGTIFWVDPQEKLVVVVGTAAPGEIRKYYREQMGALVYGALTELRRPR